MTFKGPNRYAEFNSVSEKCDITGGSLLIHYTLWRWLRVTVLNSIRSRASFADIHVSS
jgi:hypothetical protein